MTQLPLINAWGAASAGLATFVIGPAWFSPFLFGKAWSASVEASGLKKGSPPLAMGAALVASLVSAFAMAILFSFGDISTAIRGALAGFVIGLGIVAVSGLSDALFVAQARLWWLVQAGYRVVGFCIMGLIIGASTPVRAPAPSDAAKVEIGKLVPADSTTDSVTTR